MIDTDPAVQLQPYLHRIGYDGEPTRDLQTFRNLIQLHTRTIPFENLDSFLHQPVSINFADIEKKLVKGRRGGYCYEQNVLLAHVLRAIGFEVCGLAARVRWNKQEDDRTPRTHMLLKVMVEGVAMICDVGFGVMTLTAPIDLVALQEQSTPHETYRLRPVGDGHELQVLVGGEWKVLYVFGLEEHFLCDYELPNFYVSTRQGSHFRTTLMAARAGAEGRYALSNTRLTIRPIDGETTQQELSSVDEIIDTLESTFHITVPDHDALERALRREGIHPMTTQGASGA